jgi:hypothetical protein
VEAGRGAGQARRDVAARDGGRSRRRGARSLHDLAVEPAVGSEATADYDLVAEVEALSDKLYRSTTPIVVVTTEIGLGFLPPACRIAV